MYNFIPHGPCCQRQGWWLARPRKLKLMISSSHHFLPVHVWLSRPQEYFGPEAICIVSELGHRIRAESGEHAPCSFFCRASPLPSNKECYASDGHLAPLEPCFLFSFDYSVLKPFIALTLVLIQLILNL